MYASYFGLKKEPFSIAPDPRLLFMSERHREALAHLLYGLGGGGGFVLLTGEIGTGKTTVCRCFIDQVPENCNLAYIFNPKLTVSELLETVCHEFGIAVPRGGTVKDYLDPLNAFLLQAHAAGRNNVLVIDEAQNLSADVLEQLRLLTNLETSERKLLQIILVGQPELRTMLARPELEQLAQRVIARYHLQALSEAETVQYIRHRMEVCGLQRPLPFDRGALARIHRLTGGVPRKINLLCDRALLGAYASGVATVDRPIVDKAASEVFEEVPAPKRSMAKLVAAIAVLSVGGAGLLAAVKRVQEHDAPALKPSAVLTPRPASGASTGAPGAAGAPLASPAALASATPLRPASSAAVPKLLRDENAAWRELAQAWKLDPGGSGDPCDALQKQQVQCFTRALSLPVIRQLGRPGIVMLDVATGQPSYAVLTGLTDTSATLRAAGSEQTVTLAALADRWQGDFGTLWRAPEGYGGGVVEDGAKGAVVDWVAEQLAKAKSRPAPKKPAALTPALKADVRAFQVAQGLPADGKPGPLTIMQLNRAAGVDEPRLRTEP
ncbi:ExeA family protein [Ramlibacter albus]|uniref:AAA family ATPase n=1 Tax=Ramlibacter albus TaxID=2079448 RepID=A0A923M896_9BURK|nr:ExeA family protein [Ramlibacter albus]MBC5766107.1 AAA family ATPase [Ramlibacter albus]